VVLSATLLPRRVLHALSSNRIGDARIVRAVDHVRWVGGGSGAGKTTLARRLAERFGLQLDSTDEAIGVHAAELGAAAAPLLDDFRRIGMDQRWVLGDPATMYRTFPWFHGEGFELVIEDLRSLFSSGVVLAEGFRLLPDLVCPHLTNSRYGVWLLPTPAFRRTAFARRSTQEAFWSRTSDPQRALANLLERDRIFTDAVAIDAARHRLATLVIDGSRSIEEDVDDIAVRFGLLQ
jgi:2-phosphoglycerate kinase